MDTARHRLVMEVFDLVCDLPREERDAALRARCADDEALRREVESMLAHDEEESELFEAVERGRGIEAIAGDVLEEFDQASFIGEFGGYTVIREVGRGGMGVIYEARQESPRRRVALKVLQRGLSGGDVARRFRRESHVLGQLQHPGIAQIYEAGVADTPAGPRPFFAMEFIDGLPLDEHADEHGLDRRQRLELLARVCDAVEYANQKGVIHRDLKPSNVLVASSVGATMTNAATSFDAIGRPKILDFGIARIAEPDPDLTTIRTEAGQLVGTLAYMSPEQVIGDPAALDARCDVYALGAIGYQLLTGEMAQDVRGLPVPEAARVVRDDDPAPMTVHDRSLAGDVATIIAKAMDKDPARRYESAGALAADIRRHLDHVPIEARPASTFYQLQKFARRNRGLVAGIALAFLALLLGVAGTTTGLVKALRSNAKLDESVRELRDSNDHLERVSAFQAQQLAAVNPEVMGARLRRSLLDALPEDERPDAENRLARVNFTDLALDTLEQNIFERSVSTIDAQFTDTPAVRARLLQSVGATLSDLGLLDEAEGPLDEALSVRRKLLGEDNQDTIESLRSWGELQQRRGDYDASLEALRSVADWQRKHKGEAHPDTIAARLDVASVLQVAGKYEEGTAVCREAFDLAQRELGPDHPTTQDARTALATSLAAQGLSGEAEPILREALERVGSANAADDEHTLSVQYELSQLLWEFGKLDEAESLARTILAARRRSLGDDHPRTQEATRLLANILSDEGQGTEAETLLEAAYDQSRLALGEEHPSTLIAANDLASALDALGRYAEAEKLHRSTLEIRRRVLGNDNLRTLVSMGNLGYVINRQGRPEEAEPLYREMVEGMRRTQGPDSPYTLQAVQNYGVLLSTLGRTDEAEPLYRESLEGRKRLLGEDHPATLNAIYNMGDLLLRQGKLDEAEPYCEQSLEKHRAVLGENHIGTLYSLGNLGRLRMAQGRLEEAEALFREQHERMERVLGPDHPATKAAAEELAKVQSSRAQGTGSGQAP